MCTAISKTVKDSYFGRNLDFEHGFGEKITITPRNYRISFLREKEIKNHFAIIGMALPKDGYPLYFDAANEKGLSMAGLNFPENAVYFKSEEGKKNIASFEFVLWVLSQCETTDEAKELILKTNITDDAFSKDFPPTPLHWMIADKNGSIVCEQTNEGMKVYKNPVGVLTNSPPFEMHLYNLRNYLNVTAEEPENRFCPKIDLKPYSRGMGGISLPGDLSSMSRFVRASFVSLNSIFGETEEEIVCQLFHILYSVYQQKGCAKVGDGYEITNYTSLINTTKGIYYYTTYNNFSISKVNMHNEDLEQDKIIVYDLNRMCKF